MRRYEKLAGLAAIAALVVYALACRPAWSPDSTRVVFTYGSDKIMGLALHDLRTGSTRSVISFSGGMKDSMLQSIFDGEKIRILQFSEKESNQEEGEKITLFTFDSVTGSLSDLHTFGYFGMKISSALAPVLDNKGGLWLGGVEEGGPCLVKIDLKEKTLRGAGPSRSVVIGKRNDKIYCLGNGNGTIYYVAGEKERGRVEIGTFCPIKEDFTPLAVEGGFDMAQDPGFVAGAPDGSKICVPIFEKSGRLILLIVDSKEGTSSRFILPMKVESSGGVVFPAHSRTVWVAFFPKTKDEARTLPALAEVDPDKGIIRQITLPIKSEEVNDEMGSSLQPSISPDGKRLAVNTSFAVEDPGAGRLFLVDLGDEKGTCREVAPPRLPR